MKTIYWPVRALLFVILLQVVSCTKTTNDSVSVETSSDATLVPSYGDCKLRRVHQDFGGDPNSVKVSGLFTYNSAGNPISVIYTHNGTGNPNHYFIYDKQNRLREHQLRYSDFVVERHLYGYNAQNQIVKDTMTNREAGGYFVNISTLEYDNAGRIIKETIVNTVNEGAPIRPTRRPTYTYDNRGNLAVAGWKSSSYDNKVSVFRSHPVFQFIHRNYSMNNAAPQAKYNSKGLPLSVNPGNDAFFNAVTTYVVVYDCQ